MAQTADLRPEVRTTQSWEDKIWLNQWPFNKDTVLDYHTTRSSSTAVDARS